MGAFTKDELQRFRTIARKLNAIAQVRFLNARSVSSKSSRLSWISIFRQHRFRSYDVSLLKRKMKCRTTVHCGLRPDMPAVPLDDPLDNG
jgi:hypothetical protein